MGKLVGDIKWLKSSERKLLEKLSSQRTNASEPFSRELAKRASKVTAKLGVKIALLVERNGKVAYTVVGDRNTVYLPDLGRYRLNEARLRRLRLLVFVPEGQHDLRKRKPEEATATINQLSVPKNSFESPEISRDLITDLEKLRFDALLVVAVSSDGLPRQLTMAYLRPYASDKRFAANSLGFETEYAYHPDAYTFDFNFSEFIEELENAFSSTRETGYDTSDDHAVIVGVYTGSKDIEYSQAELYELSRAAGVQVLDSVIQRRAKLDPKTVVGKGKLEEIVLHCLDLGADLLLFDCELSPGQLRSITRSTELRVIDRSMLILDIFASNAKSREGKLQVELAQLKYLLPRLTDKDTGLSRLAGGIGGRGPGETKLEVSRRRTRDRLSWLEKQLATVAKQRDLRREQRQVRGVPVIAIVGYTNAGKSTLLNSLTNSAVITEDKMFATLDTSSRRLRYPDDKEVVLVDTVGFIRDLPEELVAAFKSTLEEVGEADLLVHVVDASEEGVEKRVEVVRNTLNNLGFGETPEVLVLNKCDLLNTLEAKALQRSFSAIAVSALDRKSQKVLVTEIKEQLRNCFEGQDPGRATEIVSTPEA